MFADLNLSHVVRPSAPTCPLLELSRHALHVVVRPSAPACPLLELSSPALHVAVRLSELACPLLELSSPALHVAVRPSAPACPLLELSRPAFNVLNFGRNFEISAEISVPAPYRYDIHEFVSFLVFAVKVGKFRSKSEISAEISAFKLGRNGEILAFVNWVRPPAGRV